MKSHDYYRERYERDLELHKFTKLDKVKKTFDMTTKEIMVATLVSVAMAPVLYYGTILLMAMIYAVTGVR